MSYPVPAPEADSYGNVPGVAAYVGIYTDDGEFTALTTPTYARVVMWIDQVSDMFNVALASAGFSTPITQVDAAAAISAFVEQLVSDLAHAANAKGRFFTDAFQSSGGSVMGKIWDEIYDWVLAHSVGFINLGIPRVTGTIGRIGYKSVDAGGDPIYPMTQRKGFGNEFRDWTGTGSRRNIDNG